MLNNFRLIQGALRFSRGVMAGREEWRFHSSALQVRTHRGGMESERERERERDRERGGRRRVNERWEDDRRYEKKSVK